MATNLGNPTPEALDPKVKALASAILKKESGGNYEAKGGSGEYGAYQFMPGTWKSWAAKHLGDANAAMTVENQNRVAYNQIKEWKDQGLNPAQIASKWNSGRENAYKNNHQGVNDFGVAYNTTKYAADVSNLYRQELKKIKPIEANAAEVSGAMPSVAELSANQMADAQSAGEYKPIIPANTQNPNMFAEAAKVPVNTLSSAWSFAKGLGSLINPVNILKNVFSLPGEFMALNEESKTNDLLTPLARSKPGVPKQVEKNPESIQNLIDVLPKTAYEGLLPASARSAVNVLSNETGLSDKLGSSKSWIAPKDTDSALNDVQRGIVNDPVGQILPLVLGAKGIAEKAGLGAAFDRGVSKVASPITRPVSAITNFGTNTAGAAAKFVTGQATGLAPDTIGQIVENPQSFSKASRAAIDRSSLGKEVQSVLSKKSKSLSETGEAYKPIRESNQNVFVDKKWLENSIKENTGLDLQKGKLKTSGKAAVRDASDVRAMQHLYDLWKPVFDKGKLSSNELLNFRQDLAGLSKFERAIGKSKPIENITKQIYGKFNTEYRNMIPGLEALDTEFSGQRAQLKELSKGLIDKSGNLTDAAINRIANATGKGKDILIARLEEIVPGITQKIKVLKAIEDIQAASGFKVGTYSRGSLIGGSALVGGPLQAIITAILTSPEIAVPMIRRFGLIKNSAAIKAIVNGLKMTNELPNKEVGPNIKEDNSIAPVAPQAQQAPVEASRPTTGAFSRKDMSNRVAEPQAPTIADVESFADFLRKENSNTRKAPSVKRTTTPKNNNSEPFIDFLNKENKTSNFGKNQSALVDEAKQYKTADDFINDTHQIVYHGTDKIFDKFDPKKGDVWFTDDMSAIDRGVGAKGKGQVMERALPKDLNLATPELLDEFQADGLIKQGYDGVFYPGELADGTGNFYQIFNTKSVKTKTELSDLWKKSNKKTNFGKS